jgi:hypothetical protein
MSARATTLRNDSRIRHAATEVRHVLDVEAQRPPKAVRCSDQLDSRCAFIDSSGFASILLEKSNTLKLRSSHGFATLLSSY